VPQPGFGNHSVLILSLSPNEQMVVFVDKVVLFSEILGFPEEPFDLDETSSFLVVAALLVLSFLSQWIYVVHVVKKFFLERAVSSFWLMLSSFVVISRSHPFRCQTLEEINLYISFLMIDKQRVVRTIFLKDVAHLSPSLPILSM